MNISDFIKDSTKLIENFKAIEEEGKEFKDIEIEKLIRLLDESKNTKEDLEIVIKSLLEIMKKKVKL